MAAIDIVHELPNPYDRLKLEIVGSCFALQPAKTRVTLGLLSKSKYQRTFLHSVPGVERALYERQTVRPGHTVSV
jgi:hypothetical protein